MKFHATVIDVHAKLKAALEEKSEKRIDTENALLKYWGIDSKDGNIVIEEH